MSNPQYYNKYQKYKSKYLQTRESPKTSRSYTHFIEDVMKEDFRYGFKQEDLWELAKNKEVIKYDMNDI